MRDEIIVDETCGRNWVEREAAINGSTVVATVADGMPPATTKYLEGRLRRPAPDKCAHPVLRPRRAAVRNAESESESDRGSSADRLSDRHRR